MSTYASEHIARRMTRPTLTKPRWGIIHYVIVSIAIIAAVLYLFTASVTMSLAYDALRRAVHPATAERARSETPSLVVIARRPAATLAE